MVCRRAIGLSVTSLAVSRHVGKRRATRDQHEVVDDGQRQSTDDGHSEPKREGDGVRRPRSHRRQSR